MKIIIINKSNNSKILDNIVSRTDSYIGMKWSKIVYNINTNKDIEVKVLLENGDEDKVVVN